MVFAPAIVPSWHHIAVGYNRERGREPLCLWRTPPKKTEKKVPGYVPSWQECQWYNYNYLVRGWQNAVAFSDIATAGNCYFVEAKRQFLFSKCQKCVLRKSENYFAFDHVTLAMNLFSAQSFFRVWGCAFIHGKCKQNHVAYHQVQVKIMQRSINCKWRSCSVASSANEDHVA